MGWEICEVRFCREKRDKPVQLYVFGEEFFSLVRASHRCLTLQGMICLSRIIEKLVCPWLAFKDSETQRKMR